jgi:hypothetical protein
MTGSKAPVARTAHARCALHPVAHCVRSLVPVLASPAPSLRQRGATRHGQPAAKPPVTAPLIVITANSFRGGVEGRWFSRPQCRYGSSRRYRLAVITMSPTRPRPHRASRLPSLVGGPSLRSGPPTPSRVRLAAFGRSSARREVRRASCSRRQSRRRRHRTAVYL